MSKSANPPSEPRSPFNPFQTWLGFPPGRIPNNYYALFGVPLFEPDTKLIAQLADNMLAHVRQIRPGEHAAEWTELLDTIRNAKEWLCDPQKKKIYDQQLEAGNVTSLHFTWPTQSQRTEESPRPLAESKVSQVAAVTKLESIPTPTTVAPEKVSPASQMTVSDEGDSLSSVRWLAVLGRLGAIAVLVLAIVVTYRTFRPRIGWVSLLLSSPATSGDSKPSDQTADLPVAPGTRPITKDAATQKGDIGGAAPQRENRAKESAPFIDQPSENTTSAEKSNPGAEASNSGSHNSSTPPTAPQAPTPSESSMLAIPSGVGGEASPPPQATENSGQTTAGGAGHSSEHPQASAESRNPSAVSDLTEEFRTTLNQIWESLAQRDLEGARAGLNRLASQVRSDSHRRIVGAMDQLVRDVEQFWKIMAEIVASLQSAEELPVGDTYVIVVEATRDSLVLRAAGQNRRYALREIPTILIESLARRRLHPGPDSDILLAAFLAVDPKGDLAEAQRLLERARAQGGDIELIAEALRYRPNGGSGTSRLPVPASGAEVLEADRWLEQQFGARIKQIASIPDAQALAQDLMAAAENPALAPAIRYRVFREILRLAESYGLADSGINAIDRLSRVFQVDFWTEAAQLAESWAGHRFRPAESQSIAKVLLPLVDRALRENRREEARRLAQAGLTLARQSSNIGLIRQYLSVLQQLPGEKTP